MKMHPDSKILILANKKIAEQRKEIERLTEIIVRLTNDRDRVHNDAGILEHALLSIRAEAAAALKALDKGA